MDEVSQVLTGQQHSGSKCDCTERLPVKYICAVNTSVVLSISHIGTAIDQCQLDRF